MKHSFQRGISTEAICTVGAAILAWASFAPAMACDEKTKVIDAGADVRSQPAQIYLRSVAACDSITSTSSSGGDEEVTYLQAVGAAPRDDGQRFAVAHPSISASRLVVRGLPQDGEIEIVVKDGDISVRHNGEKVPADRIRRDGRRVIVLDKSGREMANLNIEVTDGGTVRTWSGNEGAEGLRSAVPAAQQPPVMLGIMMEAPGPALAAHLAFEQDSASLITALYEGLPAHEAGLGQYDIVISIDGESSADPESLRAALKEKEPDEVLRLGVIQKGQRQTVEVKLQKYDASAMQQARLIGEAGAALGSGIHPFFYHGDQWRDLVVTPDHQIYEWVPGLQHRFWEKDLPQLRRQSDELNRHGQIEQLEKRLEGLGGILKRAEQGDDGQDASSALDRLEERLKKLEQQLEKLIERSESGDS